MPEIRYKRLKGMVINMINIAIDGPAGAGKSTVARRVAAKFGYIYVDTGALYRAIGVYALGKGAKTDSAAAVVPLLGEISLSLEYKNGEQCVIMNGEDVSRRIRLPEASMAASNVSAIPEVRSFLFDLQRDIAKGNNCVMDGRDIGTVVLPDAAVKVFLTASAAVRAKRRFDELEEKGTPVDYNTLLAEIEQRDYNDSHRATAPLKQAEDAVLVDSSDKNIDEVTAEIAKLVASVTGKSL